MAGSLQEIKANIRSVLISSTKFFTISELERDYKKIVGDPIPYGTLGYTTLKAFLASLEDVLHINGYGCNALVVPVVSQKTQHIDSMVRKQKKNTRHNDRRRFEPRMYVESSSSLPSNTSEERNREESKWNPPLPEKIKNPEPVEYYVPSLPSIRPEIFPNHVDSDDDNALPNMDPDDPLCFFGYPPDAIRLTSEINRIQSIMELTQDNIFRIVISELFTPYKFWFQFYDTNLKQLMFKMNNFYKDLCDEDYQMDSNHFMQNRVCAIRYNGMWHRAEIVTDELDSDGLIKTYLFDYGTIIHVNPKYVKFLMKPFQELPKQALRGRMAFIEPKHVKWTRKESKGFLKVTNNLILYGTCEYFDADTETHYLSICNTYGEEDINVADTMISQGFAVKSHLKGKRGPALQYPTFKMLETGLMMPQLLYL